jgi:FtsH-binding integral membrane protein
MDHLNNDRFYDEPIQRSATSGMAKVYGWMFLGLMLTAVMSIVTLATPLGYYVYNQPVMIGLMIAEFALVVFLSARVLKMNYGTAVVSFLAYALLNGITLSVIFFAYTGPSIAFAFLFTAGAFGIMSVYGLMTKNDLTSIGSFLFMGLIGIILASVVNMFLRSPGL